MKEKVKKHGTEWLQTAGSVGYYLALLVFTLVYLVPFCLLFVLTVAFDRERVALHYASRWWAVAIFRMNPAWRLRIEGKENIERGKQYVVVTNHQSMLDIPISYVLPLTFKWVSKREVYRWPVFGMVLWMHGDIAIERGTSSAVRKMVREASGHLANGTSVIIFPEGTRSRDGQVHRFKEGAFVLAKSAGTDVLPCMIEGTGDVIDGWRLRMPHKFTVRILPAIPAAQVAEMEVAQLASEAENRIRKAKDSK